MDTYQCISISPGLIGHLKYIRRNIEQDPHLDYTYNTTATRGREWQLLGSTVDQYSDMTSRAVEILSGHYTNKFIFDTETFNYQCEHRERVPSPRC